jgi:hypothetical protein
MSNLHRSPIRQRDLNLVARGRWIRSGRRGWLDMRPAVAVRRLADRPNRQEHRRRFRPQLAAPHLAPLVPQQTGADLVSPGDLGNAATRLLGLDAAARPL